MCNYFYAYFSSNRMSLLCYTSQTVWPRSAMVSFLLSLCVDKMKMFKTLLSSAFAVHKHVLSFTLSLQLSGVNYLRREQACEIYFWDNFVIVAVSFLLMIAILRLHLQVQHHSRTWFRRWDAWAHHYLITTVADQHFVRVEAGPNFPSPPFFSFLFPAIIRLPLTNYSFSLKYWTYGLLDLKTSTLLPARVVQTGRVMHNSLYVNDIEHVRVTGCDGILSRSRPLVGHWCRQ